MLRISDLRIQFRLAAAFSLLLLGTAVMLWAAQSQMDRASAVASDLVANNLRNVTLAREAQVAAQESATLLQSLFILDEQEQRIPVYRTIDANTQRRDAALRALLQSARHPETASLIAEVERARDSFVEKLSGTTELVELRTSRARDMMLTETAPALQELLAGLERLARNQSDQAARLASDLDELNRRSRHELIQFGMAVCMIGLLLAIGVARTITTPLSKAAEVARDVAAGKLSGAMPAAGGDEVGDLVRALSHMREGIAQREARILELAYRDTLTGLPNRAAFAAELDRRLESSKEDSPQLAVALLDLDRFRGINDLLGHAVGDAVLNFVARRLEPVLARHEGFLARFGGDEFALITPASDPSRAEALGRELLLALQDPLVVEGQAMDIGGSLGISLAPLHGTVRRALVSRADLALYSAKQGRSGLRIFDESLLTSSGEGLALLSDLRAALDQGQLSLRFQPKVQLRTGKCHCAEVLLRWAHPTRGNVAPDQFIPFAEHTGFIVHLTRWVLAESCSTLHEWRAAGLEVQLHVNISARDLTQAGFPELVAELLNQYHLPPGSLGLEITESAMMEEPERAMQALERLDQMGVVLSIDDFGVGHSSLTYLRSLPVSRLKIDQSFVRGLSSRMEDELIVRSTIDLAHNLGLQVVAEGVETVQVQDHLLLLDCDEAQGYLYARPLQRAEFEQWWHSHAHRPAAPARTPASDLPRQAEV